MPYKLNIQQLYIENIFEVLLNIQLGRGAGQSLHLR